MAGLYMNESVISSWRQLDLRSPDSESSWFVQP